MPGDHARQTLADRYAEREIGRPATGPWRVLDLGCGAGGSVDVFRARDPDVQWVGLDVPGSPEARERTRRDARFETFDGVSMPFEDGSFDLVYCKQVLEHVRHPEPLLAEVRRVLTPGGWFAGSTSQLEPYHSLSLWNYTPGRVRRPPGAREPPPGRAAPGHRRPHADRLAPGRRPPLLSPLVGPGIAAQPGPERLRARARRPTSGRSTPTKLLFCGQFAFLARREANAA